jgi:hypothetical protein
MLGGERFVVFLILSVSIFCFIRHNSEGERKGRQALVTGIYNWV